MNTNSIPSSTWQELKAPDGRSYYYNTHTKTTQWSKPDELLTPIDRALSAQPWKEYTAPDGRKYYAHSQSKKTVWEMPAEYRQALEASVTSPVPPTPAASTPASFVASSSTALSQYQTPRDFPSTANFESRRETIPLPAVVKEAIPDYSTFEEAEAAFTKLLRRSNVQPDWTWQQAMRATIKDPQYRALKDPKDRKAAFEKYAVEVREQEKEKAKERLAKLRTDFNAMLRTHPEIKHNSRWKTIRPIIQGETVFRSTSDEEERKQFFAEYIVELKKQNVEKEAVDRKSAILDLTSILQALDLEPYTRWSQAQEMIQSNPRFQGDDRFKLVTKSDILTAFENHIKSLERSFNDTRQQQKAEKVRTERQNRDAFAELLKEKRAQGQIRAGSMWSTLLPRIENDSRYVNILGQGGSTPLDMFWDVVEEEERALRSLRNDVYDALEDKRYEVTSKTSFDEFLDVMLTDRRTAGIAKDDLELIFDRLRDKVQKREHEDKNAANRQRKRAIDALRHRMKGLEPRIHLGDTWEQVQPRLENIEEYRDLNDDDRKAAFDKFILRLQEREDEDREREKRKARRNEEREYRNGHHRESRHGRLSKTPEADPYAADRRKAMAARERQYRKASIEMSPSATSYRDHRDRDDRHSSRLDRPSPSRLVSYDREMRRDRRGDPDEERERLYRTRADPRGSRDELNYGEDSRSVTSDRRRRRETPEDTLLDDARRKRHRRDSPVDTPSKEVKSVEVQKEASEAAGVHSGSEEGEIEED